jgi:hypothetical protein
MPNKTEAKDKLDPFDSRPEKSNWALVNPIIAIDKLAINKLIPIFTNGKKEP